MMSATKKIELDELISKIDDWHLYDQPLSKNDNEFSEDGFFVQYGECDAGDTKIFRGLIIHIETMKTYRFSFNSLWCPETKKKWLLDVILSHHVGMIKQAHRNAIGNVRDAYCNFSRAIGV